MSSGIRVALSIYSSAYYMSHQGTGCTIAAAAGVALRSCGRSLVDVARPMNLWYNIFLVESVILAPVPHPFFMIEYYGS